jgi:hypothetical protein
MPQTALPKSTFSFLNKRQLAKLRLKAKRAGVWFRVLPRIDRALVDLTIRVADSVRSITLAKHLLAVTMKLEGLLESRILRAFRDIAPKVAQKLSLMAQEWGNSSAKSWISNVSFLKFLAVMHINDPKTFKT